MDSSDSSLSQLRLQAIQAALEARWQDALEKNLQIIDLDPKNVDALNRTARAYFEMGNFIQSKHFFERSLELDPYNSIATKFLKRLATFRGHKIVTNNFPSNGHTLLINADLFIKEPGKSKLINLTKLAEPQKLSLLSSGGEVKLNLKSHCISVTDISGEYLGILPDDVSHRLIKFINGGNKYQSFIKSIKPNSVIILVKETSRSSRFKNTPSFPEAYDLTYPSDHIGLLPDEEPPIEDEEETLS